MAIRIVPLARDHDRSSFSSGSAALDQWFRNQAGQDERRNVARVFVAVDHALGLVGFYALSTFTLAVEQLPESATRKLPRYDQLPAALIGRLARDIRCKGQDVGPLLLGDAIRRIVTVNQTIAVHAIVVDAKDERAAAFYGRFGFLAFPSRQDRLFLPVGTAEKAFGVAYSG
jgi:hypothetical protein